MNVKKCVRALLCLYLTLIIAMDAVKAQALKVGDTLPPELWSMPLQVVNHPTGKETLTLSEYKDKLIILDFWATWCAPCIKSLTKLDTLQKEFSEQLAVIPVTQEKSDKISLFLKKKQWSLPSVTDNVSLKSHFPHVYIPHYVWIQNNKVIATTGHETMDKELLKNVLETRTVGVAQKKDRVNFDNSKPLFLSDNGISLKHYSLLSGPMEGVTIMHSSLLDADTTLHNRVFAINCSILQLYKIAFGELWGYPLNRIVLDVKSPEKLLRSDLPTQENLYCYERRTRPVSVQKLKSQMATDLDHYFGLSARIEKRVADCFGLTSNRALVSDGEAPAHNIYDKDAEETYMTNQPVNLLIDYLNNHLPLYVINTTGLSENIDIVLPNLHRGHTSALDIALEKYGFQLVKVKKELDVFVITDKPEKL